MTRSGFFYLLFCLGVVVLFLYAGRNGYSPFADGGARAFGFVSRGPTHK